MMLLVWACTLAAFSCSYASKHCGDRGLGIQHAAVDAARSDRLGVRLRLGEDASGIVAIDFKVVPVGTYMMGSDSESEAAMPSHEVTISRPFGIATTRTTTRQWQQVLGDIPTLSECDDQSTFVNRVSWQDCTKFAERVAELTGKSVRLPTEAEWEYARRLEGTGDSDASDQTSNAHPLGLIFDKSNSYEWCQDWFGPYAKTPQQDPTGPNVGTERVLRGGAWPSRSRQYHMTYRGSMMPSYADCDIGFRLVLVIGDVSGDTPSPVSQDGPRLFLEEL
jgi:formylglycine-generating enzyme required for sulfatase activity